MIGRNIKLVYILSFLKNSWFWLGIWVFYYLKFTDYAGIGLIETMMIVAITLSEVPTGAVADLFGKRKTLILSFLLQAVGLALIAMASKLIFLVAGVVVSGIGGAFYSGTLEALVYDTLKENNREDIYPKIIANINSILLLAPAAAGLIGGYLYILNPYLPFYLHSIFYLAGMIISIFLIEPHIDTFKFNLGNYLRQTLTGIKELTKTADIKRQTVLLLSIGFFVVLADEMLNSFLGVEFGFKVNELAILWSVIYLLSSLSIQFVPYLYKLLKFNKLMVTTGVVIAVTFLVTPVLGLVSGGFFLLLRSIAQSVVNNVASIAVNNSTESKYRATTLSTFNMIKNIPYILTAFFIGSLADRYTAKNTAFVLGCVLLTFIIIQLYFSRRRIIS